jgi:hypothetical protein
LMAHSPRRWYACDRDARLMPIDSFDVGAIGSERYEALLLLGDWGRRRAKNGDEGLVTEFICVRGGVEVETLGPWAPLRVVVGLNVQAHAPLVRVAFRRAQSHFRACLEHRK